MHTHSIARMDAKKRLEYDTAMESHVVVVTVKGEITERVLVGDLDEMGYRTEQEKNEFLKQFSL